MSIQIVEIAQPSVIDTVAVAQPSTVAVVEVRQGPAGTGGGATTFAALTDKATADLLINAPLASALSGKQPLDADLTSWASVARAAGFDTFTATPSSASLRSLVTDETGTGSLVFGTSPTLAGFSTTGAVTFSTGTTFSYGAGIAAAHRTALGLGSLATQNGTFSGTHSGDSSGTNTGDQDLSNLLSRRTTLEVNGTDPVISQSLVEQGYLFNGRRVWANGDGGTLLYDGTSWRLSQLDPDSIIVYEAFNTSGSYEPWKLTGWGFYEGSGQPSFTIDPPALLPVNNSGTIALSTDQQGRVSPADMTGLGTGVSTALDLPADTNGGFLTAGTGGTLPITRGGTGATTAGLARTALGSGATGDALFTAANPAAARGTLELGNLATLNSPLAVASGGTGTTNGSITGTGALTFTSASAQPINLAYGAGSFVHITSGVTPAAGLLSSDLAVISANGTAPSFAIISASSSSVAHRAVFKGVRSRGTVQVPTAATSGDSVLSFLGAIYDGAATQATALIDFVVDGAVSVNTAPQRIGFFTGPTNGASRTERMTVKSDGNVGIGTTSPSALLDVNSDTVRLRTTRTPASAGAAGNAGDICWDADYIYVCTATNTWKRTAIATW